MLLIVHVLWIIRMSVQKYSIFIFKKEKNYYSILQSKHYLHCSSWYNLFGTQQPLQYTACRSGCQALDSYSNKEDAHNLHIHRDNHENKDKHHCILSIHASMQTRRQNLHSFLGIRWKRVGIEHRIDHPILDPFILKLLDSI